MFAMTSLRSLYVLTLFVVCEWTECLAGSCEVSWKLYGNHCYYFSGGNKNWHTAKAYCISMDSDLVKIETAEENTFLSENLPVYNDYWIGLTDEASEGRWVWTSDNSLLSNTNYVNWRSGEPNNNYIYQNEDCGSLDRNLPEKWNDLTCSLSVGFICESPIKADCGSLSQPADGSVAMTTTTYGSTATYSCNTGYDLNGATTVTCQADGTWDTLPTCVIKDCGNPTAPSDGDVTFTTTTYKSVATLTCDTGYSQTGASSATCLDTGVWSDSSSTCTIVDCGSLSHPAHGSVAMTTTTYGSTATYSCNTGYDLNGATTVTCQADGTWDTLPTCVIKDCGNPSAPSNGDVTFTTTTYNSVVTFTCDIGYSQTGASLATCLDTGVWSDSSSTCTIVDCGSLGQPAGGSVAMTTTTYGSTATYSCNTGYDLYGATTVTCQADGTWETLPTCVIKDCGNPSAPSNGDVTFTTTTYNSVVTFTCDIGYSQTGASSATCLDTGVWSESSSSCTIVDCGSLGQPAGGSVAMTTTTYGSTATYSCNTGYDLYGATTVTCQADGTWETLPTCVIKDCGNPSAPSNGDVTFTTTTYNSVVTFTCDIGYSQTGASSATCLDTGVWSESSSSCTIVDCGSLGQPADGSVAMTSTTYGSTATYSCNTGYDLNGGTTVTCQADGTWETLSACVIKDCGHPSAPSNGDVTFTTTTYNSVVTFTCDIGYSQTGASSATCLDTGVWSDSSSTCTIVDCGSLGQPAGGSVAMTTTTYGSTATYSCNTGYDLYGATTVTCQADGTWETLSTCVIKDCGNPSAPSNGDVTFTTTTYNSVVTFTCDIGYSQTGASSATCLDTGVWSESSSSCTIVDCGSLGQPADGSVAMTSTTYGSTATYSCNTGYDLNGGTTVTCQADGTWETLSACVIKDCGHPSAPSNGDVTFTTTTYNSVVTFTCDIGYSQTGASSATCLDTGVWSDSSSTCTIVDCGSLGQPAGGSVAMTTTTYGSTATYSCNTGYDLYGATTVTCQADGTWETLSTCVIKDCGNPSAPSNGDVTFTTTTYNSVVTFTCDIGYSQTGASSATCLDTGVWSDSSSTCTIVDCGSLGQPADGSVAMTTTTYGSTATYSCNTGYDLNGATTVTCQADGTWETLPTCVIKDCGNPSAPSNGDVTFTTTTYNSVVTFTCDIGYSQTGASSATCLDTGVWSDSSSTCTIVDCGSLGQPADGSVAMTTTTYGSTATYSCNTGYDLNGVTTVTCQADGTWDTLPTCEADVTFVCHPNDTIAVYHLPPDINCYAMQNSTPGTSTQCNITRMDERTVRVTGCSKDLPIVFSFGTFSGMEMFKIYGGRLLTTIKIQCSEIPEAGNIHSVNTSYRASLELDEEAIIDPTYDVTSSLNTTTTIAGYPVLWTISFPVEYILEVSNCTAYPGLDVSSSLSVQLISSGGCNMEEMLISDFVDNLDGTATAVFYAFKFYRVESVFLQCSVAVCPDNAYHECDTSCTKVKRAVKEENSGDTRKLYRGNIQNVLRVLGESSTATTIKASALEIGAPLILALLAVICL